MVGEKNFKLCHPMASCQNRHDDQQQSHPMGQPWSLNGQDALKRHFDI